MQLHDLLQEYRQSHGHPTNKLIHMICVPIIVFSTLALLWKLNFELLGMTGPAAYWINGGTILAAVATLYYASLGTRPLLGMGVIAGLVLALIIAIESAGLPLLAIAGGVFVAAWAVQLYGHKLEGAKPSFFKDLQFLFVGPLFVLDELGFHVEPAPLRQPSH